MNVRMKSKNSTAVKSRKKPRIDAHTLMVNEIFHSIQGESSFAGRPCVFLRLTYCNLRCSYCDTEYAFYQGEPLDIDDVLAAIHSYDCPLIEITGGEPLLQEPVFNLMRRLCDDGLEVLLETGGSRSVAEVDPRVHKIVDMKCPSSNMSHKNLLANLGYLSERDELKFVIGTRGDYEWSLKLLRKHPELSAVGAILLSPVYGKIPPVRIVDWMLADRLQKEFPNIRFQTQMHKAVWPPDMRGV